MTRYYVWVYVRDINECFSNFVYEDSPIKALEQLWAISKIPTPIQNTADNDWQAVDFGEAAKAPSNAPDVVQERGEKYGAAWLITGELLTKLNGKGLLDRLFETPYAYNWVIAFNKLIRALASPTEPDHWKDLEGYAYLVRKDLDPNS